MNNKNLYTYHIPLPTGYVLYVDSDNIEYTHAIIINTDKEKKNWEVWKLCLDEQTALEEANRLKKSNTVIDATITPTAILMCD